MLMKLPLACLLFLAASAHAEGPENPAADPPALAWSADAWSAPSFEGLARTPPVMANLPPDTGLTEVPEPSSAVLLLAGVLGLLALRQPAHSRQP